METTYLIVVEAYGAGKHAYHSMPYRIASTLPEALQMMEEYQRNAAENDRYPEADFFLVYQENAGTFMTDPGIFNGDVKTGERVFESYQRFLQETERA